MPEISRFYGIIIKMYYDDHAPPHFHAEYGRHQAVFDIRTLGRISGKLPPKAMGLVTEWATLHQHDLLADWELARSCQPLNKVEPLE